MGHKEETMGKLLIKLQAALEDYQSIETETMCNMEQMGCQILDKHGNLIALKGLTSEYTIRVNTNLDSEDFGSHTMNKFALYKSLAKQLQDSLVANS